MSNEEYIIDPEIILEFIDESQDNLNDVANVLISLENNPSDKEGIDTIFRTVHTIKGNSAFFNLLKIKSMAHILEDLMGLVREGTVQFNDVILQVLIRGIDFLKKMLVNVQRSKPEVDDMKAYDDLLADVTREVEKGSEKNPALAWQSLHKDIKIFSAEFKDENPYRDATPKEGVTIDSQSITINGEKIGRCYDIFMNIL